MDAVNGDNDSLRRIVTGDESWVWAYEPESKRDSSQWINPKTDNRPQKFRRSRSTLKVMICVFFDVQGVIHVEFLMTRVTSEVYIDILMHLRDSIRLRRPRLWREHNWILLDDNASVHTSDETMTFLHQVKMTRGDHPPYSPDLAPCDFFLFPKMKNEMRGKRYRNMQELKNAVNQVLDSFTPEDFHDCFDRLQDRWQRCVSAEGNYFEGMKLMDE